MAKFVSANEKEGVLLKMGIIVASDYRVVKVEKVRAHSIFKLFSRSDNTADGYSVEVVGEHDDHRYGFEFNGKGIFDKDEYKMKAGALLRGIPLDDYSDHQGYYICDVVPLSSLERYTKTKEGKDENGTYAVDSDDVTEEEHYRCSLPLTIYRYEGDRIAFKASAKLDFTPSPGGLIRDSPDELPSRVEAEVKLTSLKWESMEPTYAYKEENYSRNLLGRY